jgi:Domain of unknown function (DUF4398)
MRRLPGLLCALVLCAACSAPPQKEIDTAQGAIEAARAAGADEYAADSYQAAVASLQAANDAVAQGDYRTALSRALDARERAHQAAQQAADGKARTRSESEAAITAASTALLRLQRQIKAAEAARVPAKELAPARTAARNAETAVQKARAAVGAGRYLEVRPALAGANEEINATIRRLDEIGAARNARAKSRRR